jgi:hypothetical protein
MPDTDLAWLVPVLNRPQKVGPLLDAIARTTPNAQVVFVVDPDDRAELEAIGRAKADVEVLTWLTGGSWAFKINEAARVTKRPLLMLGADDLEPCEGWLHHAESKLSDTCKVVGVNDLIKRRREHTTHFLMARDYALQPLLDGSRGPAPESYSHSFCDDELIATARHRGAYRYAGAAHVRHFHPLAQRSQRAEDDETYRIGRRRFHKDKRLFEKRSHLWT